jgi:hypothetical protein
MSIVSNQTESLASFLSEAAASSGRSPGRSTNERFSSSLELALESAGLTGEQVTVQVPPSSVQSANLPPGTQQYLVTVSGAPSASADPSETTLPQHPGGASSGPWITKEMWTDEMLDGEISNEVFMKIQDKAEFMNTRLDRVQSPTSANVLNDNDGTKLPLNGSHLATRSQAEEVRQLLEEIGIDAGEVKEVGFGGPFEVQWGDEDRRLFTVAGRSVGLILERYAKYPKERADQMMRDEFNV